VTPTHVLRFYVEVYRAVLNYIYITVLSFNGGAVKIMEVSK